MTTVRIAPSASAPAAAAQPVGAEHHTPRMWPGVLALVALQTAAYGAVVLAALPT